jgi:hypothetical protein
LAARGYNLLGSLDCLHFSFGSMIGNVTEFIVNSPASPFPVSLDHQLLDVDLVVIAV